MEEVVEQKSVRCRTKQFTKYEESRQKHDSLLDAQKVNILRVVDKYRLDNNTVYSVSCSDGKFRFVSSAELRLRLPKLLDEYYQGQATQADSISYLRDLNQNE